MPHMPLEGERALALGSCSSAPEALGSERWVSTAFAVGTMLNMLVIQTLLV